jgi:hypothetical protein
MIEHMTVEQLAEAARYHEMMARLYREQMERIP